jgi:hypothetical protein
MFNFKNFSYDVLSENYNLIEKKLTRTKFFELVMENEYSLVREYINPKFNIFLPKDYTFNENYYVYKQLPNDFVEFNHEYYNFFKNNNWTPKEIYEVLNDKKLNKYSFKKENKVYKDMIGIGFKKIVYFFITSAVIFSLFYNFASNPFNNEFIGSKNKTIKSSELVKDGKEVSYVEMNDEVLNEINRTIDGNWQKLKPSINVSYTLCKVKDDKKTYLLIEDRKEKQEKTDCKGVGVIQKIEFPNFQKEINAFLPEIILNRDKIDPNEKILYKEAITKITQEYGIDEPIAVIHKNSKIISQNDQQLRTSLLYLISILPVLFGLLLIYLQHKFKLKLQTIRQNIDKSIN